MIFLVWVRRVPACFTVFTPYFLELMFGEVGCSLCGECFVNLLRSGFTGCSLPRRFVTGNMCPCFHAVGDRRSARMVVSNGGILVFNSGTCVKLACSGHVVSTSVTTARGCNANYTNSHFLGKALSVRIRLRGRLTRFMKGSRTLYFSAKFAMGRNVVPTIMNHKSCVVYSSHSRTSVMSNHHLTFTARLGCGRGSVRTLRGRLRGYRPSTMGLVIISKMFSVRNSLTGLPRVIHLGGGCGTDVCISRTRNLNMFKGRNHNIYSRFNIARSMSLVVNAFDGSLTSVNNFITKSGTMVG